jgi:hypothetical protein
MCKTIGDCFIHSFIHKNYHNDNRSFGRSKKNKEKEDALPQKQYIRQLSNNSDLADNSMDDSANSNYRRGTYSPSTVETLYMIDEQNINFDILEYLILYVCAHKDEKGGSILVFLPGTKVMHVYMVCAFH